MDSQLGCLDGMSHGPCIPFCDVKEISEVVRVLITVKKENSLGLDDVVVGSPEKEEVLGKVFNNLQLPFMCLYSTNKLYCLIHLDS